MGTPDPVLSQTAPKPRDPAATSTAPDLWADSRYAEDPVALLCELVDLHGEEQATGMWMWAALRLSCERKRLIAELLFVCRQRGEA